MKNKILKTTVIILLIVVMTIYDFLLIGNSLISYAVSAINDDSTNHDNVKFTAYFKNQEGKKSTSIDYAMNNSDMKLYMKIEVKNEGYFDGKVFCDNSNFNIKPEILNENISRIEGKTITLNRITAGKTVEIEVGIEPIIRENYELNLLDMESEIQISGIYKDSTERNTSIYGIKKICLNLLAPDDLQTTLQARVLTNKVYKINDEDKRIVQIEMVSGIVQNAYPVESTTLEIETLPNVESVQISTKGTLATNGKKETLLDESSYKFNKEDNLLRINLENTSEQGNISWKKNAIDTVIVTFVLGQDIQIPQEELEIKSNVKFYGQKEVENGVTYQLTDEKEGIIEVSIQNNEKSIYKGKLYSKQQREYQTTTNIEVNYVGTSDYINLKETTQYNSETEAKTANIQYASTTILKEEVIKILGEEGILNIKDQDGNLQATINNQTKTDDNGNIVVNYSEGVKELIIEATAPTQVGIIRMQHVKIIKPDEYTKEEAKTLKKIEETVVAQYNEQGQIHSYNENIELKDTITTANLSVVPQTLATTVLNEQVKISLILKTDNEMYELFKNPAIKIKLPDCIKSIHTETLKANKLYLDEFTVPKFSYAQETREIEIKLLGEQKAYTESNTNGYIEILADIELEETTPNGKDKIVLTYTNENGDTLENGGIHEVPINITGYNGLVALSNITDYNLKGDSITKEEQIGNLKTNSEATEANFQIALINNTGNNVENLKAIGNLPVQGTIKIGDNTFENTIQATLKSKINTNGIGTVYYTSNENATDDLKNSQNGWTTNLQEVSNPTLYMIQVDNMAKGSNLIADYTMDIPANLNYSEEMKTAYTVNYVSNETQETIEGATIGLETGNVLVTLDATVGGETLQNGSTVKTGEVIRYKITVTNSGSTDATNVTVSALVPEGTVFVRPYYKDEENNFVYEDRYYDEYEQVKTVEATIETLKANETKIIDYEVKAKSSISHTTNKSTIIYNNDIEVYSNELAYNIEEGDIVVTIKRATDSSVKLNPYVRVQYFIIVENLSNTAQENLKLNFNYPDELTKGTIEKPESANETEDGIIISSLGANSRAIFKAFFDVNEISEEELETFVSASVEKEGNIYRSNDYKETIYGHKVYMQVDVTKEGETLEAGEHIDYEITITNDSSIYTESYTLDLDVPNQLTILKIEQDGQEQEIINDNSVFEELKLNAKSTTKIKVTTIVNYDINRLETEEIASKIELKYMGMLKDEKTVVHYLKSIVQVPPEDPDNPPIDPENPDNPPIDPENPDNPPVDPDDPDNPPTDPDDPDKPKDKYNITGKAWLDRNKDGEMNGEDDILQNINVKLLNVKTNQFVKDSQTGKDIEVVTDDKGYYIFDNIEEGKYIVVFDYDSTLYKPTTYQKTNVEESKNSNAVSKQLTISGEEKEYAVTNRIELAQNISNLNLGLVFIKKFEMQVDKYISKVIVQTTKGTTTYSYDNKNFAKVEINAKRMLGSTIIVQYTIKVTNAGDVDAYVNELVDYAPTGFKFNSELNTDWYEADDKLVTNRFTNEKIAPGENREINLTLIKTKTEESAELVNNMAEIKEAYNPYGIEDTNSTFGNKNKDEKDLGSADLLIGVQTGKAQSYILLVITMIAVIGIAALFINRKIIKNEF